MCLTRLCKIVDDVDVKFAWYNRFKTNANQSRQSACAAVMLNSHVYMCVRMCLRMCVGMFAFTCAHVCPCLLCRHTHVYMQILTITTTQQHNTTCVVQLLHVVHCCPCEKCVVQLLHVVQCCLYEYMERERERENETERETA